MEFGKVIKSKFDSEWGKAIVNTIFTGNFLTDLTMAVLKPYSLNDQHFNILRILRGQYPKCASPGYIKEVLINKRGDLTRLSDKLVKLGYIERFPNPENRRMVNLKITQNGLNLLEKLSGETAVYMNAVQSNLSEEEAKQLNYLLDKLRG